MSGPASRWVPGEGHLPGYEQEPHFQCEVTGLFSHERHAVVDQWGRKVKGNEAGALDIGDPANEPDPLTSNWPFDSPNSDATVSDENPRPFWPATHT